MSQTSTFHQTAPESGATPAHSIGISRRDRRATAERISKRLNLPFSSHKLRMSEVPYKIVAGRALYEDSDSDAYADKLLSDAPRRMGGRSPRNS